MYPNVLKLHEKGRPFCSLKIQHKTKSMTSASMRSKAVSTVCDWISNIIVITSDISVIPFAEFLLSSISKLLFFAFSIFSFIIIPPHIFIIYSLASFYTFLRYFCRLFYYTFGIFFCQYLITLLSHLFWPNIFSLFLSYFQ